MKGERWRDLKNSLKNVIAKISDDSKDNFISIINFSSNAILEYKYDSPDSIDTERLSFFNDGTNFSSAFQTAYLLMKNHDNRLNTYLIFMTDGNGQYPENEIKEINKLVQSNSFSNVKFKFYGLHFKEKGDVLRKIVENLNGEFKFAIDGEELKKRYVEIFTNSLE